MKVERLPPHDIGAEEAVLGSIMVDPSGVHEVPWLKKEHFYIAANGIIYDTLRDMVMDGIEPDIVTAHGRLEAAGLEFDIADLIGLLNVVPTSSNIKHYADIVRDESTRRQLIQSAGQIATAAHDDSIGVSEVRRIASKTLLDVSGSDASGSPQSLKQTASKALDEVFELQALGGKMRGIPSGYDAIDEILRGIEGSRLYVCGARPGVGKTGFGTQLAINAARLGKSVAILSLEMSGEQLVKRMCGQISDTSYDDISEGNLTAEELARVTRSFGELSELPIEIIAASAHSPGVHTPGELYSYCMRLKATTGLDMVIVDYMQLMSSDKPYSNRVLEVGAISRALAGISIKLDVPIFALAQLSRALERRENKRPILTDLRDSGEVEQDAAVVIFLYREEYYALEGDEEENDFVPGLCEFIVAKNRFGKTGVAKLHFEGYSGKFSSYKPGTYTLPGPLS